MKTIDFENLKIESYNLIYHSNNHTSDKMKFSGVLISDNPKLNKQVFYRVIKNEIKDSNYNEVLNIVYLKKEPKRTFKSLKDLYN